MIKSKYETKTIQRSYINDVTTLGGKGCAEVLVLLLNSVKMDGWSHGVAKNIKNCMTSFMDDP